jgi:predicted nucleic acid-binding protein
MNKLQVCLDASFVVRYLASSSEETIYQEKWSHWNTEDYTIVAPTLMMYEVSNAFHRAVVARQINSSEAEQLLEFAGQLGIRFYGDLELHKQALKLAKIYALPAIYDAHYLALAERLEIELWTADRRLFNAVNASLPWVNLVR